MLLRVLRVVRVMRVMHVMQGAFRGQLARAVVRQLIRGRFRKDFDADSGQHYYVDLVTNETHWEKPRLMGTDDIEVKDEWIKFTRTDGTEYVVKSLSISYFPISLFPIGIHFLPSNMSLFSG